MQFLDAIIDKARANRRTIVFAEGEDPRIIEAASRIEHDQIAKCILIGDPLAIDQSAAKNSFEIANIVIENPVTSSLRAGLSEKLFELRQHKGMTPSEADASVNDPLCFADLMLRCDFADGSIAGALYTSGDRVRSALQIVGVAPGFNSVSSFFLMLFEQPEKSVMLFSDCALIVEPDATQLAEIAIATAQSAKRLLNEEPRLAMLSFSTDGSAKHPLVDKVRSATELARQQLPGIAIDGEVQLDAAIVPSVAAQKMRNSEVNGNANVLIFPDLNAGNIGYKLAQRFGGATAIGPILQGLSRPANDLSRGCSTEDVYYLTALTAAQSQV